MTLDTKIVGGTLVDGSGAERFRGDIGIKDGKIVEVGDVAGAADHVIDAEGAIVTPGFTDIHTHYDGQVSWDSDLAPSSIHGVTTVVMGSCGVGFAPVRPTDHERLVELMEGVEDIPGSALAEGLTWNWETFPQYMSAIDFPHAINFACHVPHDALRVYMMGDRAVANEVATDEDIANMRQAVVEALKAGAVGFSTGRSDNHRDAAGQATPASEANTRELVGIAKALEGFEHGVLQAVSDFDMAEGPDRFDTEFDVIERMAEAGGSHPTSVSLMQRTQDPDQWKRMIARAEAASKKGTTIRLQVGARGIGVMLGLEATFHPFMGFPSYRKIAHLPLAERVKQMRDPAFREQLLKEKSGKVAGDGSALPPLADVLLEKIDFVSLSVFQLGDDPNYEPKMEESLYYRAREKGITPLAAMYDAMLEKDGKELLYFPIYNYAEFNLDNVHTMLSHPLALPGLSDGGAHVGTICDASFPTFMLTHWARDRSSGRIPLERVVQMMTGDTSKFVCMHDRGLLKPGMRADINVIDMDKLRLERPHMVRDLPAGGQRLIQNAQGYRTTLVGGTAVTKDGKLTGEKPGRLVRVG